MLFQVRAVLEQIGRIPTSSCGVMNLIIVALDLVVVEGSSGVARLIPRNPDNAGVVEPDVRPRDDSVWHSDVS